MVDGSLQQFSPVSKAELWDDYYACMHDAYNALRETFDSTGMTQDQLAARIHVDKSLVSRRLNGSENLTMKTLSHMGTGMGYRVVILFRPYDQIGYDNYYYATPLHSNTSSVVHQFNVEYSMPNVQPSASAKTANDAKELEKV
jgi:transcriptional regulator with XRE-family HTH domain